MNRSPKIHTMLMGMVMLTGCAGPSVVYNYEDSGSYADNAPYSSDVDYDTSCDYYTPPWGYPADYCRYQLWSEPVYYGGVWYSGPIYSRIYGGERWYWLNGDWRHDEWRGARPNIDWSRGRNVYWKGDVHRGRNDFAGGRRPAERRINDRRDSDPRGFDNDFRNEPPRRDGVAGDRFDSRGRENSGRDGGGNEGGNGRFGDRGRGNDVRDNNVVMPNPGRGPGNVPGNVNAGNPPAQPNQGNGRFRDGDGGNAGRGNAATTPPVDRGPANTGTAGNLPPSNGNGRFGDRGVGNGGRESNAPLPNARNGDDRPSNPGQGNAGGNRTVAAPESSQGPTNDNPRRGRVSSEVLRAMARGEKPGKPDADNPNR